MVSQLNMFMNQSKKIQFHKMHMNKNLKSNQAIFFKSRINKLKIKIILNKPNLNQKMNNYSHVPRNFQISGLELKNK